MMGATDKNDQRVTIWRMFCLVASESVRQHVNLSFRKPWLPGATSALLRWRLRPFFLEPTIMAVEAKVDINNLQFCRVSEAGQHGLLGLKSFEDQSIEKQQGESQSFQQSLHSEVRS